MTVPKSFADQDLLSTGEVAAIMKVHRGTVWHWIRVGLLKAEKVTARYSGVSKRSLSDFKKLYGQASPKASAAAVSPKKGKASDKGKRRRAK